MVRQCINNYGTLSNSFTCIHAKEFDNVWIFMDDFLSDNSEYNITKSDYKKTFLNIFFSRHLYFLSDCF